MCEFISWKEYKGKNYFLTNADLDTKEGRKLLKYLKDNNSMCDLCGHGAIEGYYPELKNKGINKEQTDFSSPANFPKDIAQAIKANNMIKIGFNTNLLNSKGKVEYEKIEQSAYAKYEKIRQSALAEYEKIQQSALAEYEKIQQSAWAKYEKIRQSAYAEYEKIEQSAYAKYEKIRQSAWAEYEKIRQPALAEYEKIKQPACWKLFKQKKYRNKNWVTPQGKIK